jgi:outer membrane protein OmpA-like peptidoglycan-associated protein
VAAKSSSEPALPEFVPEPEPAGMVPVPPMTTAEIDDGIGAHTIYYDEEQMPDRGDGIMVWWDNPDYAAQLAAAEAQMARADLPPPAPPAPVPEPPAVLAQPAPSPAPRTLRLTLEGETHFGFNKYQLTPSGREKVDKLVGELEVADYDVILVTGHSDRIGTKAYNQKLSERRALNVKQYLTKHGIDEKRVQAKWVGAAEPVTAPGACDGLDRAKKIQCLAPDRRVEVQVINAKPR